jgi:hypothetical protein
MQIDSKTNVMRRRRPILSCLMLLLLSFTAPCGVAQDAAVPEADLKAAFLFNFAKFVEWPAEAFPQEDSPLTIGIYGDEDFTSTLRTLIKDKKAHGRAFVVKRLTTIQEAKSCQMLFFRDAEGKRVFPALYDSIKRSSILTVGESEDFLDAGGMLNLFFEDKRLRFDVNPAPAESAKLSISSQLLRLAKNIRKGGTK